MTQLNTMKSAGYLVWFVVVLTSSSAGAAQAVEGRKLYPKDESSLVPSFAAFKAALLTAAQAGDVRAIRAALAPTVLLSFEDVHADDVITTLNIRPGVSWRELVDVLRLGVVREQDQDGAPTFVAPYVSALAAQIEYDEFAIVGREVAMRERPNRTSAVIERLSYDVVRAGPDDQFGATGDDDSVDKPRAWTQVISPSGKTGYVYGRYLRSPAATRFHFRQVNGEWKIVYITSGD
jgi:hypothetical protein